MSGKAECRDCGLVFASDRAFDRHRTGSIEARRCLTLEEMRAGKPRSHYGVTLWFQNHYGHWTFRAARRALGPGPEVTRRARKAVTGAPGTARARQMPLGAMFGPSPVPEPALGGRS